jgi:hypothetical protein
VSYDQQPQLDTTPEADFAHRMLLAWAAWVYGSGRLGAKSCAKVLGIQGSTSEVDGHPILSEDQLIAIDKAIAKLPMKMQRIIHVHYRSSEDEPMFRRYIRIGIERHQYRQLLFSMQTALYAGLMPDVDEWRHSVV